MVLNFGSLFGKERLFKVNPEDGQILTYFGQRIIPTDLPLEFKSTWNSGITYEEDNWVTHDGILYRCILENKNQTPPNATYWQQLTTDTIGSDTVTLTPLESALNVLQLQVAAAITPGNYVSVKMDIFSEEEGYLDTIDTANTTALYRDDSHYTTTGDETSIVTTGTEDYEDGTWTFSVSIKEAGYFSKIGFNTDTSETMTISVKQGGVTLASKSVFHKGEGTMEFSEGDYTSLLAEGPCDIVYTCTGIDDIVTSGENHSFTGELFTYASQRVPTGTGGLVAKFQSRGEDKIVQTNPITIPPGATSFQVSGFRTTTTGTGNITADISFDNGTNWQTDVPINTNTKITNSGTLMILKLNLNVGDDYDTAQTEGWGVQIW